jgi:hypothetical protein
MDNDNAFTSPIDDRDHQVYHSTPDDAGNNQQIIVSSEHTNTAEEVLTTTAWKEELCKPHCKVNQLACC